MNRRFFILLFLISLCILDLKAGYKDLEAEIDLSVIQTKQIVIPGYDAFNPSIIRWKGSLLLCFRYRDPITESTDHMGFVWLDEDFNLKSPPIPLIRLLEPCSRLSRGQDPRLMELEGDLYIIYNNFIDLPEGENRRMIISKVIEGEFAFFSMNYEIIKDFPSHIPTRQEKNWVPFIYEDTLLLSYSLNPHHVLLPLLEGTEKAITFASTKKRNQWKWGELRGGTSALRINDHQYLAFFHSVKTEATLQSNGKAIPHYFMGAYLFNANPPFEITKISPKPIVGPNFYNGIVHKTWKPLRVVFPGGFVFDEKFIWVVYGRQDHENWVVKFDKTKLLKSLVDTGQTID